jgi:hypothetical protein
MEQNKPNTASELLSKELQQYAAQLEKGDIKEVCRISGIHWNTIPAYLKGDVAIAKNGIAILNAMKQILLKREREIKKAIA